MSNVTRITTTVPVTAAVAERDGTNQETVQSPGIEALLCDLIHEVRQVRAQLELITEVQNAHSD